MTLSPVNCRHTPAPGHTRPLRLAWWAVLLHALSLGLLVVPWYHPVYRLPVQLLNLALLVTSALAIVLVLMPAYVRHRQWGRALAGLCAGTALIVGTGHAHAWRMAWTDHLLQTHHCHENTQVSSARVLGGLVRAGGLGAGDGAEFINSTHCLLVVCQEELFRCPRPSLTNDVHRP